MHWRDSYNTKLQYYEYVPLRLLVRRDYPYKQAKRFLINDTNQNVWIPNRHLMEDGTIKPNENLNYIFRTKSAHRKMELANVISPVPQINLFN